MPTERFISSRRHAMAMMLAPVYGLLVGAVTLPDVLASMAAGGIGGSAAPRAMSIGVFLAINVALPAGSVGVAFICPRKRIVLVSVIGLFLAFWTTRAMYREPRVWAWTATNLLNWTHPAVLASLVVSLGLAILAAAVWNAAGRLIASPPSDPTPPS